MRCFQALLFPCFQYFQYFCNIFQYFKCIFCTFFVLSEYSENKGQNWTKNTRFSTLRAPAPIPLWFSIVFSHWNVCNQDPKSRGWIFLLFKYFLDNLFLTAFVQNAISKFVEVLPQKLHNSLLEKSCAHFYAAVCWNCVCKIWSQSFKVTEWVSTTQKSFIN